MFSPKNNDIIKISNKPELIPIINKLERLFVGKVNVYVDFANVRPWSEKLGWHVSAHRVSRFLKSFNNIDSIKWYQGELIGDQTSESEIKKLEGNKKIILRTKPVKIMRISIDATSVSKDSPDLLRKFIRKSLLRKYDLDTIESLNEKFSVMNQRGEYFIEDRKCNFDVEIGTDIRVDHLRDGVDTFVLWSGDSDFYDPIKTLLDEKKKVILFSTSGRIARELNDLVKEGLFIFDISDLKEFICWKRERAI